MIIDSCGTVHFASNCYMLLHLMLLLITHLKGLLNGDL